MDSQNNYSNFFEQSFKRETPLEQHISYDLHMSNPNTAPAFGGLPMYRNHSDDSNQSDYSLDSYTSSMSFDHDDSSAYRYRQNFTGYYDADVPSMSFNDVCPTTKPSLPSSHNEERYTPESLGWTTNSEFLRCYNFKIPKNKTPYLELAPGWDVTPDTPKKVYLDSRYYLSSLEHCKELTQKQRLKERSLPMLSSK